MVPRAGGAPSHGRRACLGALATCLALVAPIDARAETPPAIGEPSPHPAGGAGPAPSDPRATRWNASSDLRLRSWGGQELSAFGGLDGGRGAAFRARLRGDASQGALAAALELQSSGHFGGAALAAQSPLVGLQQATLRWRAGGDGSFAFEAGRMRLSYGAARHIGSFDFDAQGHAYDGARVLWLPSDGLRVDLLGVRLHHPAAHAAAAGASAGLPASSGLSGLGSTTTGGRTLVGAYVQAQPVASLRGDLYLLALDDGVAEARVRTQTLGLRLDWQPPRLWRVDAEVAAQVGAHDGGEESAPGQLAWMAALGAGLHTDTALPFEAKLFFETWSGDVDDADGVDGAWRPLYGDRDRIVGILQRLPPTNLQILGGRLALGAAAGWQAQLEARLFARRDAVGSGLAGRQGRWAAHAAEIDLRVSWRPLAALELALSAALFAPVGRDGESASAGEAGGDGADPMARAIVLEARGWL